MSMKMRIWLMFLIFLNGYVSMSLELIVMRQISFFVGSAAVITSIIIGTFLGFMSFGYFMGGRYVPKNPARALGWNMILIALFGALAASFPLIATYFQTMYAAGIQSGVVQTFIFAFALLSVGPFLFGFNTTLLAHMLHSHNTNYAGNIMAWDTIGSVIASIATTLLLMPMLGVNNTVIMVVGLTLVAAVCLNLRVMSSVVALLIMCGALYINSDAVQEKYFGIIVNNANSTITVQDNGNVRLLYMNGLPMSMYYPASGSSAPYMDYINNNFIYTMPRDRVYKILVLGAGGFTAGLNDDFNDYTFVDIEPTLKDITEQRFLRRPLGPNKKFVVRDASQFLKNTDQEYDLIILDVYSNSYQIPESLITAEFMSRIKSRVAPNGIILMNMVTSPAFEDTYTRVFDNTFHRMFPHNTQRQVIGHMNPWVHSDAANVIYIYYNRKNDTRIYTINKTPVIYDSAY